MQDKKAQSVNSASVPSVAKTKAPKADSKGDDSRLKSVQPSMMPKKSVVRRIADKIQTSENILVALSRDPSVDELAAAIGLTMYLDGLRKHVTAIYSGQTPDVLRFLQPEGTFETNTDSLQDFIVSLNKEKVDHLRYDIDGDFVRVYITPYKALITQEDLEFSRGDYNVDLVLALGVPTAPDLDAALSEYGRIMHDAMTVDITCDVPGKFAEVEWSDLNASSVSEMVTRLIFDIEGDDVVLDKDVATAFLTGIVAATGRFSNDRTSSNTMQLASKLMSMGADQQLIAAHMAEGNEMYMSSGFSMPQEQVMSAPEVEMAQVVEEAPVEEEAPVDNGSVIVTPDVPVVNADDEARIARAQAASAAVSEAVAAATAYAAAAGATGVGIPKTNIQETNNPAVNIQQMNNTGAGNETGVKNYAQMIEQALREGSADGGAAQPKVVATPKPVMEPGAMAQPGTGAQPGAMAQVAEPIPAPVAQLVSTEQPAKAGQPVENPQAGVVLPPPPDPTAGPAGMPPVLPPVQVPEEMKQQTQAAQQAQMQTPQQPQVQSAGIQSAAFQIPGM